MAFENLFSSDNDYIIEANSLGRIELDTEPLYEINTQKQVLFTTKLRYYALLIEKEINRHLNAVTNLLEEQDDEDLSKFILKKTRDAVTSLINQSNRQITILDKSDHNWKIIISNNPDYKDFRNEKELIVFYHYLIAQLTRCWLELQDRYAYVIGKELYDVNLFYSSYVKRTPDAVFEVKHTSKYDDEAKKFKKCRPDCCFLYDNKEYFAIAIQELTNKLRQHHLIPDDIDCKYMESLFSGRSCRRTYQWLGDNHILTHIIKGLTDDDNPIITTWPEGTSKWEVVSCRFVDKEGNYLPNIRTEKERIKAKTIVKEAVDALAGYLY
ncbi:MAG: hypothetical protein IJV20_00455 [Prevotella sp.]|nr:hypothetical protein [Prevotella sp.]